MKTIIKSWLLKIARNLLWRADEWIHAQELALREPVRVVAAAPPPEVDRVASAARERAHRKATRPARLKYVGGQFVRQGVR